MKIYGMEAGTDKLLGERHYVLVFDMAYEDGKYASNSYTAEIKFPSTAEHRFNARVFAARPYSPDKPRYNRYFDTAEEAVKHLDAWLKRNYFADAYAETDEE